MPFSADLHSKPFNNEHGTKNHFFTSQTTSFSFAKMLIATQSLRKY